MERAYCAGYIYFGDCLYRNQIHWKYREAFRAMQVYSLIGLFYLFYWFRTIRLTIAGGKDAKNGESWSTIQEIWPLRLHLQTTPKSELILSA